MIHDIVLAFPEVSLEKNFNFLEVKGDSIVFNFIIDGVDLTGWQVKGELYDLNTSIRMANENVLGVGSHPEIVMTSAKDGKFTATVAHGATGTFQKYGQVEFCLVDPLDHKYTIMQQLVTFNNERIIWDDESKGVVEDPGVNPLF